MKKNEPKEKKELSWWQWALIIIVILFILDLFDSSDDYEYCVKDCASELSYCLSSSAEYSGTTEYILGSEADYCSYDLEDCVRDCKN